MSKKSIHVVPNKNKGGWDIKQSGGERSSGHFDTKQSESLKIYCNVLNTDVEIDLGYASIPNVTRVVNSFNCQNACVECGVVNDSQANQIYNWSVCPISAKYT